MISPLFPAISLADLMYDSEKFFASVMADKAKITQKCFWYRIEFLYLCHHNCLFVGGQFLFFENSGCVLTLNA